LPPEGKENSQRPSSPFHATLANDLYSSSSTRAVYNLQIPPESSTSRNHPTWRSEAPR
jgi:hypothetical protein